MPLSLRQLESLVLSVIEGDTPPLEAVGPLTEYQRHWIPGLDAFWASGVRGVPTDVFRRLPLHTGEHPPTREFLTSGTTHGARGRSPRVSTLCYDRGAQLHFRACLGSLSALPIFALVEPSPTSSLAHMLQDSLGVPCTFLLSSQGYHLSALGAQTSPLLLFSTSFALDALLPELPPLPAGSALIFTGGMKGRGGELSFSQLAARAAGHLEIPESMVFQEYSMTELSSQLWGRDLLTPPGWLEVSARDPISLEPVPAGTPGVLLFHDLANVDVPFAIQTADMGRVLPDGSVQLLGRTPGATPRGCSLAAQELLGST
ncbi:MAG: hypothetical protein H6700_01120 [Myxococcales bacterium]|nr:hypothetical protein [Myxococcales bacterium]